MRIGLKKRRAFHPVSESMEARAAASSVLIMPEVLPTAVRQHRLDASNANRSTEEDRKVKGTAVAPPYRHVIDASAPNGAAANSVAIPQSNSKAPLPSKFARDLRASSPARTPAVITAFSSLPNQTTQSSGQASPRVANTMPEIRPQSGTKYGIRPMTLAPPLAEATTESGTANDVNTWVASSYSSGGGSNSGSDVQLGISGGANHGVRKNADGTYPAAPTDVMQGMRWEGDPVLTGTAASSYTIVKYTWTISEGAVKGYGQFAKRFERGENDATGEYEIFAGGPTSTDGVEVKMELPTADDLTLIRDGTEVNDHVINKWYWGPEASGPKEVKIVATLRHTTTMDEISREATYKVNVVQPEGTITRDGISEAGVSGVLSDGFQYVQFGKDWDGPTWNLKTPREIYNSPNVGFKWTAQITQPINRTSDLFGVVQTVTSTDRYIYTNSQGQPITIEKRLPVYDANGVLVAKNPIVGALDSNFPYSNTFREKNGSFSTGAHAYVGEQLKGSDNPGTAPLAKKGLIENPVSHTRSDTFSMTLLYKPGPHQNPMDTIYIPVANMPWSWSGSATYNDAATPKWSGNPANQDENVPAQSQPAHSNASFPEWNRNVNASKPLRI